MRDCANATMRDRLPDLLHAAADDLALAEVRAHVSSCDDCREELELLRLARAAAPAPRVDVERIAAAIPPFVPQPHWGRLARSRQLRVAAAVVVIAGGAVAGYVHSSRVAPDTMLAQATAEPGTPELGLAEPLTDLSDDDLMALLEEMSQLQADLPTETDVVMVPAVEGGAL